jgi:hypothetical protein
MLLVAAPRRRTIGEALSQGKSQTYGNLFSCEALN